MPVLVCVLSGDGHRSSKNGDPTMDRRPNVDDAGGSDIDSNDTEHPDSTDAIGYVDGTGDTDGIDDSDADGIDKALAGYDRRSFLRGSSAVAALIAAGMSPEAIAAAQPDVPEGDIEELLEDLPDNWGKWGDDDELGALNYLGSEQMYDGMHAAMRKGRENVAGFTLQVPMTGFENPDGEIQDPLFPGRVVGRRDNVADATNAEPATGGMKFADDKFVTTLYLQGTTHLDALAHPWYGDHLYNRFDASTTHTEREYTETEMPTFDGLGGVPIIGCESDEPVEETFGLGKADISGPAEQGVMGRGVLLDVGRAMGGNEEDIYDDRLAPETCISLEDMHETAEEQGVEIEERDVLLIRTGSIPRAYEPPEEQDAPWNPLVEPGICFSEDLVRWVDDMEIPFIGADNIALEKLNQVVEQNGEDVLITNPLHGAFLRDLGVYISEILWLEELGAQCAADGIYDFLFTAAPLYAEMSTGAPMNPTIIKASDTDPEDGDEGERTSRADV